MGVEGGVIAYGNYGRPLLVFPSEQGRCFDYENNGMIGVLAGLIDDGRLKVYCVDSFDGATWVDKSIPLEERARRHNAYEDWILNQVVPFVQEAVREFRSRVKAALRRAAGSSGSASSARR